MKDANKTRLTIIALVGLALLLFFVLKRVSPATAQVISNAAEPLAMPFAGFVPSSPMGDINIDFGDVAPYRPNAYSWPRSAYQPLNIPPGIFDDPRNSNLPFGNTPNSLNSNRDAGTCGGCGCTSEEKAETQVNFHNMIAGW